MKENKTILQKIKASVESLLSEQESAEEVKVELAQMSLEDGTVLEAESFEAGQDVFIVNEDERIALPAGEYLMADGMVLTVVEEGVIDSIGESVEEEPAEEEMAQEFVTVEQFNNAIEEIKAMLSKTEELETKVEELSKEKEELETKLSEPSVKPLKKAPTEAKVELAKTSKGRLIDAIHSIKNN